MEFQWLSCDDSLLVGVVFDLAQPLHLNGLDHKTTLEEQPEASYVLGVEYRVKMLLDRFDSLNLLYQIFSLEELPLKTKRGTISRHEWIRIALDVLLSRLTSIRDCAFFLISEVYELGLNPRQVFKKNLKRKLPDSEQDLNKQIDIISNLGRDFRNERDADFKFFVSDGQETTDN